MRNEVNKVLPGFTDLKQQPAILKKMTDYAGKHGLTKQEIEKHGRDMRVLLLLGKAMKADEGYVIPKEVVDTLGRGFFDRILLLHGTKP